MAVLTPRVVLIGTVTAVAALATSCSSAPAASMDPATYRQEVAAICARTAAERAQLIDPVDAATTVAFAEQVATVLESEADAVRELRAPDGLDDDRRAFVQNTDDQVRRWRELAATPIDSAAAFGAVQTAILELTLGRDDLSIEMGVDACVVAAAQPG